MISGIIFIIKAQYQCQYIFLEIFSHITTLSSSEKVCYSLLLPGNYMNDLKINQEYWDINPDFWRFPGNILDFFCETRSRTLRDGRGRALCLSQMRYNFGLHLVAKVKVISIQQYTVLMDAIITNKVIAERTFLFTHYSSYKKHLG